VSEEPLACAEPSVAFSIDVVLLIKELKMLWTLELASCLDDAPWPATKEELLDYAIRTGAPMEAIENLQELEDSDEPYESMEEIWPDYPTDKDFYYEDDENDKY
jgi:hypothetical protein